MQLHYYKVIFLSSGLCAVFQAPDKATAIKLCRETSNGNNNFAVAAYNPGNENNPPLYIEK